MVPRLPRRTDENYKKESRINIDIMNDKSTHKLDFSDVTLEQKAKNNNFHIKVQAESQRPDQTTQPKKLDQEDQNSKTNNTQGPERIQRKPNNHAASSPQILNTFGNNDDESELHWKYFYTLQKYVHQMAKFYPHFRMIFLDINRSTSKRKKKCRQFCHYLKNIFLYITPILSLFFRFDAAQNRAMRGIVFSQRMHVIAVSLFLISMSIQNHSNFVIVYGCIFSILYYPNSLWRLIFIPRLGNPHGQKLSLGMIRIIPSLENSHAFKYKMSGSLILQILIVFIYIGSSTGLFIVAGMESKAEQFNDALKAFAVATGIGILVIAPMKAFILALILTSNPKQSCLKSAKCLLLDEQILELYNDVCLLRSLWKAEEKGDPKYHPEWKKAIMVQLTTY